MTEEERLLREERDRCWRAIRKLAPAAGSAWCPRWIVDLANDAFELPAEYPRETS